MAIDTKTALLNSAEHAARTLGFNGFSYADLAVDVGIRKASVHHHFPTKAALSIALMQRYLTNFQASCSNIDASQTSASGRLSAMINNYRNALDNGKSICLCVALSASRENLPEETIEQIGHHRIIIIKWLRNVFAAGQVDGSISDTQDPQAEAAATLSLLEGAHLAARAEKNIELFENATSLLRQRLSQVH